MTAEDMTQDTPGTAQANDSAVSRAIAQYRRDMQIVPLRVGWHAKARAQTRAERALWRAVKHEAARGALVFVQIKGTLIVFGNDATRVSRVLRLPTPCRQLRLRRESCDSLLDTLQGRGIDVQIANLDNR